MLSLPFMPLKSTDIVVKFVQIPSEVSQLMGWIQHLISEIEEFVIGGIWTCYRSFQNWTKIVCFQIPVPFINN